MKPKAPIQRGSQCLASNFAGALAENSSMKALLRARETTEPDDDDGEKAEGYQPKAVIRLRCYACAGSGWLELVEQGEREGRLVRCVACGGSGKVAVK